MNRLATKHVMVLAALLAGLAAPALAARPTVAEEPPLSGQTAQSESLAAAPDWVPPSKDAVHAAAIDWAKSRNVEVGVREQVETIWRDLSDRATATDRLVALAESFAVVDPRAGQLVRFCTSPREGVALPELVWLSEPNVEPLMADNLRLLAIRWLVHESLYDEAQAQVGGLEPDDVVDPALLLFCRSVVYHRLLNQQEGIEAIDRLLRGEQYCPRRYVALARLMREDLGGVVEDSLDHIARRMEDIERRLELGRAGPKVRGIEDGVIESLDKLIKELEDQQQQQSQSANNNLRSSKPADDSRLMGGLGQGRVTRKRLGNKSGWGDLPPKQREQALQEIGRRFPSHYRDVIEQYFRKMAGQSSEKE